MKIKRYKNPNSNMDKLDAKLTIAAIVSTIIAAIL